MEEKVLSQQFIKTYPDILENSVHQESVFHSKNMSWFMSGKFTRSWQILMSSAPTITVQSEDYQFFTENSHVTTMNVQSEQIQAKQFKFAVLSKGFSCRSFNCSFSWYENSQLI